MTEILEIDPLDHFALFERYLLNPGAGRTEHTLIIHSKVKWPKRNTLNSDCFMPDMDLNDEAIEVLEQVPRLSG